MNLRENLGQDALRALRIVDPVALPPQATVADALDQMRARSTGCVVVTENRKPIGVITERDMLTKVLARDLPLHTPIRDVMTSPPQVMDDSCTVATVIRQMQHGGFRHMPVVDASGALCGVVSVKRIVEYMVEHFPRTVFNLPPEPVQAQSAREGA